MKNINKIIENEHKIVNKKDLYGLAKKRRTNKKFRQRGLNLNI